MCAGLLPTPPRPLSLAAGPRAGLLAGAGWESLLTPARGVTAIAFASVPAPPPPPAKALPREGAQKTRSPGAGRAGSAAGSLPRLRECSGPVISPPGSPRPPPRSPSPCCLRQAPRPSCPTENTHSPRHPPRLPGPFKQTNRNPPRRKANRRGEKLAGGDQRR
ncbi:uncharacterized protein LOC128790954 [Vidua chalybeata]|uniref:uncharacterized protein LOC128790954 n=1 Tax=Vidua chalybeata TaxID=81927 RepID=UPI0023A88149|nr:uncharacterized protein LOC128790954 [Vidua chalybeata]